jgi:hypothetical protein
VYVLNERPTFLANDQLRGSSSTSACSISSLITPTGAVEGVVVAVEFVSLPVRPMSVKVNVVLWLSGTWVMAHECLKTGEIFWGSEEPALNVMHPRVVPALTYPGQT